MVRTEPTVAVVDELMVTHVCAPRVALPGARTLLPVQTLMVVGKAMRLRTRGDGCGSGLTQWIAAGCAAQ